MKSIVLTRENVVDDGYNNKMKYKFPSSAKFADDELAIASINMYYSWYNVSSSNNNNTFSYIFPGENEILITLPDGHYEISTLNSYLQSIFVENGHYVVNSSGDYVYFGELRVNAASYKIEFVSYKLYTESEANDLNYTKPTNATWSFPTEGDARNTQLVVPDTKFGNIIGFSSGTYPEDNSLGYDFTSSSTTSPNVAVISSVLVLCGICKNSLATPSSILYAFPSGNTTFGSSISHVTELIYTSIQNATFHELNLEFKDQNLQPLKILDNQITVILSIKNKYEGTELEKAQQ